MFSLYNEAPPERKSAQLTRKSLRGAMVSNLGQLDIQSVLLMLGKHVLFPNYKATCMNAGLHVHEVCSIC